MNHIYILNEFAFSAKNRIFKYIKTIIKSSNTPPLVYFVSSVAKSDIKKSNLFIIVDQYFLLHLLFQISMTCKKYLQTIISGIYVSGP